MPRTKSSPLETKHLIAMGAGIFLPVPVLGEAILAYGLYPIIKETRICGNDSFMNSAASVAVAGLTRIELYQPFYLPTLDFISRIL
jgi:hypothetical protein